MAEEDLGQERTEAPSPRRREEARRQGQIAVSPDLNTGVQLLAAAIFFAVSGPIVGGSLIETIRHDLYHGCGQELDGKAVQAIFLSLFMRGLGIAGTLLGLLFATGVLIGLVQSGFAFVPDLLTVKWDKLDPSSGIQRLFSLGSTVKVVTSLLKVLLMAAIFYVVVTSRAGLIASLNEGTLGSSVATGWNVLMRMLLAITMGLLCIGVFDYAVQRFRLERRLRMTRQEAKEELKQEEGDPQIRARIRRLQREAAQRRMLQAVPEATVVITNPTHLAIALRYDRAKMPAPRVVALGAGFVAERIIATARDHGVPIVPNPPVARALYRFGKLDTEIPAALYQAVAEVLAFVYRLKGMA